MIKVGTRKGIPLARFPHVASVHRPLSVPVRLSERGQITKPQHEGVPQTVTPRQLSRVLGKEGQHAHPLLPCPHVPLLTWLWVHHLPTPQARASMQAEMELKEEEAARQRQRIKELEEMQQRLQEALQLEVKARRDEESVRLAQTR